MALKSRDITPREGTARKKCNHIKSTKNETEHHSFSLLLHMLQLYVLPTLYTLQHRLFCILTEVLTNGFVSARASLPCIPFLQPRSCKWK